MKLFVCDTETGGFKAERDALVSLSLIELAEDLSPARSLDLFITPCADRTVSEDAAKINGYTAELWAERGAKPLTEALTLAKEWIGDAGGTAIAHNADFDRRFLDHYQTKASISLGLKDWKCTLALFRDVCYRKHLTPQNHKLDSLALLSGHWKPDYKRGTHGAQEDALACAAGYRWLTQQLVGAGPPPALTFQGAQAFVIPFGKHVKKSIGQVAETNVGLLYLDWLRGQLEGGASNPFPAFKEAIAKYLDEPSIAADLKKLVR